jgi:hypothetical protein
MMAAKKVHVKMEVYVNAKKDFMALHVKIHAVIARRVDVI